jgi:hypothetical protein
MGCMAENERCARLCSRVAPECAAGRHFIFGATSNNEAPSSPLLDVRGTYRLSARGARPDCYLDSSLRASAIPFL